MPIDVQRIVQLRPFVYHVTASENLAALGRLQRMRPTAELMRQAGRPDLIRCRRAKSVAIAIEDQQVVIKDQRPLIEANLALDGGWEIGDFVEYLNQHVFFWPGTVDGPIANGRSLLNRYEAEAPAVMRVATADLLAANVGMQPLFCPFNSGAARQNKGQRARRGPNLFLLAEDFPRRESEVVELVFRGEVAIPNSAEFRSASGWHSLTSQTEME